MLSRWKCFAEEANSIFLRLLCLALIRTIQIFTCVNCRLCTQAHSSLKRKFNHFEDPTVLCHVTLKQAQLHLAQHCVILPHSFLLEDPWLWLCPPWSCTACSSIAGLRAALGSPSQTRGYPVIAHAQELEFARRKPKGRSGSVKPQLSFL